jgi:hypothetical protein
LISWRHFTIDVRFNKNQALIMPYFKYASYSMALS